MFKKAQRKQVKIKMAIMGPSGSGKTYSALRIAKGIGGKIAVIDSENDSASLYSDLVDFDTCPIEPPFMPNKYIQAIKEAEQAGYTTLIIDSISHAWSGQGGFLEMVDKQAAASNSRNSFAAWKKVTPVYNQFIDCILQSNIHIIATMRSKTAYEVQKNDNGKTAPVKIGLAPIQRDGLEYEFTTVLELSNEKHIAIASKDRTGIFGDAAFLPDENVGEKIIKWLNSGMKYYKDKFVHIEGDDVRVATKDGFKPLIELSHDELEKLLKIDKYKAAFYSIEKLSSISDHTADDKMLDKSLDIK